MGLGLYGRLGNLDWYRSTSDFKCNVSLALGTQHHEIAYVVGIWKGYAIHVLVAEHCEQPELAAMVSSDQPLVRYG